MFDRELPEGVQDVDHTLAVKDLVFLPELAAALTGGDETADAPVMWPEHCVDPVLLAEHDLVVVGGPDTNFWHGGLFEPVAREFARPRSSVPLALDMREGGAFPSYGSRSLTTVARRVVGGLPARPGARGPADERLYPTHAMILACRNPYAAALGRSRWCVFVAGTRSLGTSGAVLALTLMLRQMRARPGRPSSARCRPTPRGCARRSPRSWSGSPRWSRPRCAGTARAAAACAAGCRTRGPGPALQRQLRPDRGGLPRVRGAGRRHRRWATLGRLGAPPSERCVVRWPAARCSAGQEGESVQHAHQDQQEAEAGHQREVLQRAADHGAEQVGPERRGGRPDGLEALREDKVGQEDRREGDATPAKKRGPTGNDSSAAGGISQAAQREQQGQVQVHRPGHLYLALLLALAAWLIPPAALLSLPLVPRFFFAGVAVAFAPIFLANLVFAALQIMRGVHHSIRNLLGAALDTSRS